MDLSIEKLVAGAVGLPAAGFLLRWAWERIWRKKDDKAKAEGEKEKAMSAAIANQADRIVVVEKKQIEAEAREEERIRLMGRLEGEHHRLDGKVDALQTFWRSEFAKLVDQFKTFEEKVDYRLDNFRLELRGDQQQTEGRLTELLTAHQTRVHDRLNVISSEQAKMLNEMVDMLADKAGEPKMTPPRVT